MPFDEPFGCFGLVVLLVVLVISIVALVKAIQAAEAVKRLSKQVDDMTADSRKWQVKEDSAERPRPAWVPPRVEPRPTGAPAAAEAKPPVAQAPAPPPAPAPQVSPAGTRASPAASAAGPAQAPEAGPRPAPAPPWAPAALPARTAAAPAAKKPFRWEEAIGLKGLAWVGIVAVLFAVAYFVLYAYEQGWFGHIPWMRVLIPGMLGLAILGAGEVFSRKGYRPLARISTGGGLAAIYFSVFAGYALGKVQVIPAAATWPLMAAITAVAIALSVHYTSLTVAIISLVGGLAAPVLIRGADDPGHKLFLYLIAVNVGVLVVAYFKKWRVLNLLALVGTILNLTIWLYTFYWDAGSPPEKLGLIVTYLTVLWAIFFLLMVVYHLLGGRESSRLDLPVSIINVVWYFGILYQVLYADHHAWLGPVAAALGAIYLGQALAMRRWSRQEKRLILLQAGQALALVTLAIPIHFDGIYIPMAWAVWATLLFWLGLRFEDWRLRLVGLGVHVASLGALGYYAGDAWRETGMLILNGRTATFGLVAGALAVTALLYRRSPVRNRIEDTVTTAAAGLAHALTMILFVLEVQKWYATAIAAEDLAATAIRGLRSTRDAVLVVGFSAYGLLAAGFVAALRRAFHHSMGLVAFAAAFVLLAYAYAAGRLPPLEGLPAWNSVGATFGGLVACLAAAAALARYAMRDVRGSRHLHITYELLAIVAALALYLTEVGRLAARASREGDPMAATTILVLCGTGLAVFFFGVILRAAWIRSVAHQYFGLGFVVAALALMAVACIHVRHTYEIGIGNPRGIALVVVGAALAAAAAVERYARGAEPWRQWAAPLELLVWAAGLGLYLTEIVQLRENLAGTPGAMSLTSVLSLAAAGFGVYVAGLVGRAVWTRSHAHFVSACGSLIIAVLLLAAASVAVPHRYGLAVVNPRGIAMLLVAVSLAAAIGLARRAKEGAIAHRNTPITLELVAWTVVLGLYLTEIWQLAGNAAASGRPWADGSLLYLAAAGFAAYVGPLTWRGFGRGSAAYRICGLVSLGGAGILLLAPLVSGPAVYGWPLLQPRGAAYLAFIASLGWAIVQYGRRVAQRAGDLKPLLPVLTVLCHAAAIVLFTLEAYDFWNVRGDRWLSDQEHGWYARHATLSVGYALYAVGLLAAGIMRRRALLRVLALVLLGGTILKVFLFDMRKIEAIWRVLSVFGLGLFLMAGSLLYHKYRNVLFRPEQDQGGQDVASEESP